MTLSTSATVDEVLRYGAAARVERLEEAEVVLVGADAVFCDGSIVNAAGTRELAAAAARAGVPVVVAAETLKLVPSRGVEPAEALFELTPAELVETIATEEGLFAPEEIDELVGRTPFLREGYALVAPAGVH
jgi:translation initiation factor 2B subunit (eIF-2B alpha/beta/delta family)